MGDFAYMGGDALAHNCIDHIGGYSFPSQSIDNFRSMVLFFIWLKHSCAHFDKIHSIKSMLKSAWTTIIKLGMVAQFASRNIVHFEIHKNK